MAPETAAVPVAASSAASGGAPAASARVQAPPPGRSPTPQVRLARLLEAAEAFPSDAYDLSREKAALEEFAASPPPGATSAAKTRTHADVLSSFVRWHCLVRSKFAAALVDWYVSKFSVDVNLVDARGQTPFFFACYHAPLQVVRLLREKYQARLDVYDTEWVRSQCGGVGGPETHGGGFAFDRNPLHYAFRNWEFFGEVVPYLLAEAVKHKRATGINLLYDSSGTVSFFLLALTEGQQFLNHISTGSPRMAVELGLSRFPDFYALAHFFGHYRAPRRAGEGGDVEIVRDREGNARAVVAGAAAGTKSSPHPGDTATDSIKAPDTTTGKVEVATSEGVEAGAVVEEELDEEYGGTSW